MKSSIKEDLQARCEVLNKMIEMTEKKIKSLPAGRVCAKHCGQRVP